MPVRSSTFSDPLVGQSATVTTNIDPTNLTAGTQGKGRAFTISSVFDLILPNSPRQVYGIRATDRLVGGPGDPPDQLGDNVVELVVRQNLVGQDLVSLRHVDFNTQVTTNLQSFALAPPPGADRNSSDPGSCRQRPDGGGLVPISIRRQRCWNAKLHASRANIWHRAGLGDTENWTRATIIAYAPAISDSLLSGTFGTLDINQTGTWTYTLDNSRIVTENLAEGQHATDTFTVQVADQFGAFDSKTSRR